MADRSPKKLRMRMGILQPRNEGIVPGTAFVLEESEDAAKEADNATQSQSTDMGAANPSTAVSPTQHGLKTDPTGKIILVPQPSDDPNDPLNWPLAKRDLILFVLSITAVLATTLSPILAANTLSLSLYFGRTFDQMALLTGYHVLAVGVAGFFFVPSSRVWGKRHALLLGTIIIIFSSAWAGASGKSYVSLLLARLFQGIGLAPFEALVNAAVGDMYFVHQRGLRMAITNFAVFGGSFMTPVVVGVMTNRLGWQWTFYFVAIFMGVALPFLFFFVPETAYRRPDHLNTDVNISLGGMTAATVRRDDVKYGDDRTSTTHLRTESVETGQSLAAGGGETQEYHGFTKENGGTTTEKQSYWRSLSPFNGRKTDEAYWKLLLRPFPLFLQPGILWACLIQGTLIGWTVFLGIVLAAIMLGPPLFFNEVRTGYMYTGAFVGAVVGFIIAGLLSDSIPRYLTRRNKGVYEPEFRLFLVAPQLILGCAGLYGFGITANDTWRYGWFWPAFFFAFEVAGMVIGAVASSLYIVDAHRDIAIEAFTCMMVFKNVFSFGLTYSGYQWVVQAGVKKMFLWVASVQVVICCLTIPMYIFGKLNRAWFYRLRPLDKLGLGSEHVEFGWVQSISRTWKRLLRRH